MKNKKQYTNGEKIAYFKRRIAELEQKNSDDYEGQVFQSDLQKQLDRLRADQTATTKSLELIIKKLFPDSAS